MMNDASPWPEELRLQQGGSRLQITFDSGEIFVLSAEFLRTHSPSAEVKGHAPGEEKLVLAKQNVRIVGIEPIGNYAARLVFDDGHATGLYSWDYLLKLGRERDRLWAHYLSRAEEAGSSR
jgi:DUF971 family protein